VIYLPVIAFVLGLFLFIAGTSMEVRWLWIPGAAIFIVSLYWICSS
jgi:hypothetical protein